ncbi:hypothetical protein CSOJ01_13008 [Colletotrichum sojae]|uniref:Uncharacterized protein n=1 Tax=Colletotrichum sojae TaxID=2175907 RepID=A0A8H6ITV0_9PEZI|nr:hypothetical protein CSOJ01_13008 [Colletotrichum sojae]
MWDDMNHGGANEQPQILRCFHGPPPINGVVIDWKRRPGKTAKRCCEAEQPVVIVEAGVTGEARFQTARRLEPRSSVET